jgi:hypothetical protein
MGNGLQEQISLKKYQEQRHPQEEMQGNKGNIILS